MRQKTIILMLCLMMIPLLTLAEGGLDPDCAKDDPLDNQCPLDSWVYMLVLAPAVGTLTAVFLRSQALKELEKNKRNDNVIAPSLDQKPVAATSTDNHQEAA